MHFFPFLLHRLFTDDSRDSSLNNYYYLYNPLTEDVHRLVIRKRSTALLTMIMAMVMAMTW
jgi:hypothetical protein